MKNRIPEKKTSRGKHGERKSFVAVENRIMSLKGGICATARIIALLAMATLFASPASADVIALYEFESLSLASSDTDANSTAHEFGEGAFDKNGASAPSPVSIVFKDTSGSPGDGRSPNVSEGAQFVYSRADAITDGYFFTFSVSPESGKQLNLDSLSFWVENNGSAFSDIGVDISTDGTNYSTLAPALDTNELTHNVSISGFDGLTDTVFFRMPLWRSTTGGDPGTRTRIDTVTLNATVIPEPASLVLVMFGLVAGLAMFRRR